jgi:hypothetical protein
VADSTPQAYHRPQGWALSEFKNKDELTETVAQKLLLGKQSFIKQKLPNISDVPRNYPTTD